jgi:hypothetical protein
MPTLHSACWDWLWLLEKEKQQERVAAAVGKMPGQMEEGGRLPRDKTGVPAFCCVFVSLSYDVHAVHKTVVVAAWRLLLLLLLLLLQTGKRCCLLVDNNAHACSPFMLAYQSRCCCRCCCRGSAWQQVCEGSWRRHIWWR